MTFAAAQRGGNVGRQTFSVYLDTYLLGAFDPADIVYRDYMTTMIGLGPGAHTLHFVGTNN